MTFLSKSKTSFETESLNQIPHSENSRLHRRDSNQCGRQRLAFATQSEKCYQAHYINTRDNSKWQNLDEPIFADGWNAAVFDAAKNQKRAEPANHPGTIFFSPITSANPLAPLVRQALQNFLLPSRHQQSGMTRLLQSQSPAARD